MASVWIFGVTDEKSCEARDEALALLGALLVLLIEIVSGRPAPNKVGLRPVR